MADSILVAYDAAPNGQSADDGELSLDKWFSYLQGKFRAYDRQVYCDMRDRPTYGTRSTCPRNEWLDTLWSYNEGNPPLPQISVEYRDLFREVLRRARCNYAPMIVGPMVDRMELQAISTREDSDTDGDDIAAEIMEETGFGAVLKNLLIYLFALGESYGMAVDKGGAGVFTTNPVAGQQIPMIHAIDPRRCYGEPDKVNPQLLRAALVYDYDAVTGTRIAYMFLPGRKYELRQAHGTASWNWVNKTDPELIEGLDGFGGIPIVRFDNFLHMGEYEPHIDLLDRIIDITLRRDIGMWYQALRQRAVIGDEAEDDYDEASTIVEDPDRKPRTKMDWEELPLQIGPGALLKFPGDFSIWESGQTDFTPFNNGKLADVQELAAVTSTPVYLFTPNEAQSSALGAGLQREAATSKVKDRRARVEPGLKILWRMAFAMIGQSQRARRLRFHWGPIEFVTMIESAEASNQATGTLSTEDRLERCWQMTPDEALRNMQRLTADALVAAAAATPPPGAPGQTPPATASTPSPGSRAPQNGRPPQARPQPRPAAAP